MKWRAAILCGALVGQLVHAVAAADSGRSMAERVSLRVAARIALFLSEDQRGRMALDAPGLLSDVGLGLLVRRRLSLDAQLVHGVFGASRGGSPGQLLAPTLGARVHGERAQVAPFVSLSAGPAFTGALVRPLLALALGVEVALGERVSLGPELAYTQVFQKNGRGFSSDACALSLGLFVRVRPWWSAAPPPRVRPLPPPAPAPEVPAEPADEDLMGLIEQVLPSRTAQVELLAPVLFGVDSDALEPVGVAMLHEVARHLREHPELLRIAVVAYADRRGSDTHNAELARRRAERVRDWLTAHGIEQGRLELDARGERELLEGGEDEHAHGQNRRVVFRVLSRSEP